MTVRSATAFIKLPHLLAALREARRHCGGVLERVPLKRGPARPIVLIRRGQEKLHILEGDRAAAPRVLAPDRVVLVGVRAAGQYSLAFRLSYRWAEIDQCPGTGGFSMRFRVCTGAKRVGLRLGFLCPGRRSTTKSSLLRAKT